ncbi:MAG: hypothetical protein IJK78_06225 [Bacteroidales bacterium]|nr:hypothetical protein [Bacteroidales bacterium]
MKKIIFIFCVITILYGLAGCQKDNGDGNDIILLGKELYVVPLGNILPDSLKLVFPAHFGDIPKGYIPPNIEGEYAISKKEFCHSNFIELSDTLDMHLRITYQHNRVACVELHEGSTVCTDTAFVMGSGNRFTLYMVEERNMSFYGNHFITRCVVITGEKAEQGIKNLRFGSIILSAICDENAFIGSYKPGWYFIYCDGDGLAENCNWFAYQGRGGYYE